MSNALNEPLRQELEAQGDVPFEVRQVAEAFVIGSGVAPSDPIYPYALDSAIRHARRVVKSEEENGVRKWQWTGSGSIHQRFAAMSLGTLESLAYRTEATIIGFLRRLAMLRTQILIKKGTAPAQAQAQADAEVAPLLTALTTAP